MQHFERPASRRDFLCRAGGGFGALALYGLLAESGRLPSQRAQAGETAAQVSPLAPKPGQSVGRAKSVIFLFMDGGPSHLDTFDHKPMVSRFAGKPLPPTVKRVFTPMSVTENPILAPAAHLESCYGVKAVWKSRTGTATSVRTSTTFAKFVPASATASITSAVSR